MENLSDIEMDRIFLLRSQWLTAEAVADIVGINPKNDNIYKKASAFASKSKLQYENSDGNLFSRITLELWLQQNRLLPLHVAALQVGMTEKSLEFILSALSESGLMTLPPTLMSDNLVSEESIRSFHRVFSNLRGKTFSSQSDFCHLLHKAVKEELSIDIEAVYCEVSKRINAPQQYAHFRCAISHESVGLGYTEMLNMGKPIYLAPDEVSWFTLYRGYDELLPFLMGTPKPFLELKGVFNAR